jgi:hypothetical protein
MPTLCFCFRSLFLLTSCLVTQAAPAVFAANCRIESRRKRSSAAYSLDVVEDSRIGQLSTATWRVPGRVHLCKHNSGTCLRVSNIEMFGPQQLAAREVSIDENTVRSNRTTGHVGLGHTLRSHLSPLVAKNGRKANARISGKIRWHRAATKALKFIIFALCGS